MQTNYYIAMLGNRTQSFTTDFMSRLFEKNSCFRLQCDKLQNFVLLNLLSISDLYIKQISLL